MQRLRHWFGPRRHDNCLFWLFRMRLCGRVTRVFRRKGHWLGLTKFGNVVHFKCLRYEDRQSLWYYGRPHAFRTTRG